MVMEVARLGFSCDCAVSVNCVADAMLYPLLVPLIEQLLPAAGAVTSTQLPDAAESLAPPLTDQLIPFVVPPVTVAKIRRTLPAITLNPKDGCAIAMAVGVDFAAV